MPLQNIGEISLYHEISGKGPKLALIGGYNCNVSFWDPIRSMLEENFQLLVFDNRGVGRSDVPAYPYTVNQMAEDAMALLHKKQFTPCHVLGSSLGSAILQCMSRQYPDELQKIVLANSFIELKPKTKMLIKNFLALTEHAPMPLLIKAVVPWLFSDRFIQDEDAVQRYIARKADDPHPQSLLGLQNQAHALIGFSSRSWYQKISNPALVIHGEQDLYCPIGDAFALAEGLQETVLQAFPHSAHLTHVEDPETFVDVITKFLLEE